MAQGYFIRVGDKTTCGGTVISGDPAYKMGGRRVARQGDRVTCGKDRKVYVIAGGISSMSSMGLKFAGTLDSVSACRCKARLITLTAAGQLFLRCRRRQNSRSHCRFRRDRAASNCPIGKKDPRKVFP
ncbi:PAAR domain-containing protein [Acerihabitans sp. KWT182]|uniref:PAAR domain-containing protein n=1 Tax=Acerihabitans sp. KWT182 TaxID=3157919 RepID=A0AAU7Q838_9GAMM